MQVKNEIIAGLKYQGKGLQYEYPVCLPGQWMLSFPGSGESIVVRIGKYNAGLTRFNAAKSAVLPASKRFMALLHKKGQPGQPVPAPNAKDANEYFGNKFNFLYEWIHSIRKKVELLKIKKRINQLQRAIEAPKMLRPSYASLGYDADSYYIEIDNLGVMRLIETQKNRTREVRRTKDQDELLYWIFTNITFTMAFTSKRGNNADTYDHRKQIFLKQEELLGRLNPHWKEKKHAEYKAFMKKYPVDNIPGEGPAYFEALRKLIRAETIENQPNYFRFP